MFSVFRRRAASATRSEPTIKDGPLTENKARRSNVENLGVSTPTGQKHRTISGTSLSSSSTLSNSPLLNITRQQEKQELQTLNDRLAVIIDTVRRLEQDNEKLRAIVKNNAESFQFETSKVKTLYENELDDAKKLIEELAHEKSRLEIELERTRSDNNDAENRSGRFEREIRNFETRFKQSENEITELKIRCETINAELNRKIEENQVLQKNQGDFEKQNVGLKRQLENETLLRIDLENKNKTLREQIEFNEQIHRTQIEQIKEQKTLDLTQNEGLRQQYDDKLLQELQQLRSQNETEIASLREEIAAHYEKKMDDLQQTNRRLTDQITNYRSDLSSYRQRIEESSSARDAAHEKLVKIEQRCRDLEDRTYRIQHENQESLIERDQEIQRLKETIDQMQTDYQNLLDTKIGLDREISTYRKLLDSEEERLKIGERFQVGSNNVSPIRTRQKRARREMENDESSLILSNGNVD